MRLMKEMDPSFSELEFIDELSKFIIPEIIEAHAARDLEAIGLWFDPVVCKLYEAQEAILAEAKKKPDDKITRILDIKNVTVSNVL